MDSKLAVLEKFAEAKENIGQLAKISSHKDNTRREARAFLLRQLIRENQSTVNLVQVLEKVNAFGEFRFKNNIPPGYKDQNKSQNKYGDLALWFEIIDQCRNNGNNIAILITNDTKDDWCSTYNLEKGGSLKEAHPFLKHEFSSKIDKGEFYVINLKNLINILFSLKTVNDDLHKYKHLSEALGVSLGKSQTEKVIEWIIRNDEVYNDIVLDIAYWAESPDEIEVERLRDYVIDKIPFKISVDNINWTDVIVNIII